MLVGWQLVSQLLLDEIADHALGLGAEHVQRVRLDLLVRGALQGQQTDLGSVAVADHEFVVARQWRERYTGREDVGPLVGGGHGFAPPQQRVASQCDDNPHDQPARVATRTALIV